MQHRDPLPLAGATLHQKAGHLGVVAALLEAGAQVDPRNGHGETPLVLAARGRHADVVDALLAHGAAAWR